MANFKTHLTVAATISGVAATGLLIAGGASNQAVAGYFVLGTIGGLLPDLDSDTSIPLRVTFNVLAVLTCFLGVFQFGHRYSLIELVILWCACFIIVRYAVFTLFTRLTVHRGLFHSIPAAAVAGLITILIADRLFFLPPLQAWTCGAFVALGFVVHLLLDEICSVDLMGAQIKRSFGTALNLGSLSNPIGTIVLYGVVALLLYLSPPADDFAQSMLSGSTYQGIAGKLLPTRNWFDGLFDILSGQPGDLPIPWR